MNTAIQDINGFRNWYLSSWFYLEEWVKKNPDHKRTFDRIMRNKKSRYYIPKCSKYIRRTRKVYPHTPKELYKVTARYFVKGEKRWLAWYKIDWKNPQPK